MLWICANDGVPFSVGAPACPQCGSTHYRPQGEEDGPIHVIGEAGQLPDVADLGEVIEGAVLPPQGDEVKLAAPPAPAASGRGKK